MTIILGIDPGSRITGYGIIEQQGSSIKHITHGHIATKGDVLADRLHQIHEKINAVIAEHQPTCASVEQVFTCLNPQSALKLGHARGAALVAIAGCGLESHEYSAKQIKQSVVGYGAAGKQQVQHMVRALLKLTQSPQVDAADALAAAICHCHSQQLQSKLARGTTTAGSK
ncbi:MAG: crossover junction endodeoxyribonuclease RuvC [Gammaproteobacteria bacterium]|nr:crossover junction endodeoxyribonuclease RuvC [Gammaproteobacteria bacterium]MCH9743724.1 crossover junction endodeoxyribonuclease RuvC [Gammaproteobacteria bacterium]